MLCLPLFVRRCRLLYQVHRDPFTFVQPHRQGLVSLVELRPLHEQIVDFVSQTAVFRQHFVELDGFLRWLRNEIKRPWTKDKKIPTKTKTPPLLRTFLLINVFDWAIRIIKQRSKSFFFLPERKTILFLNSYFMIFVYNKDLNYSQTT